ncbi:hypothetical protein COJ43_30920 [Bacillus cereus]|nr:hypothetical protein COJ43_30920 [Bacillus cereus]
MPFRKKKQSHLKLTLHKLSLIVMWCYPTSINLRYIFIQNAVFSRIILLSFIDVIKVDISNKP